jgi:hypothetical protein
VTEWSKTLFALARAAIVALVVVTWAPEEMRLVSNPVLGASCTEYEDCAPFVCVGGGCVPCVNDDDQCSEEGENWFCDEFSGECTDGETCLPEGFPVGTGSCDACGVSTGNICPAPGYECNGGECQPIG